MTRTRRRPRPITRPCLALAGLLSLGLPSTMAHAGSLSAQSQAGMYVGGGAGLGSGDRPLRASPAWQLGVGTWFGRYDPDFALGRHIGVGLRVRQDVQPHPAAPLLRTAPQLEIRRGLDLLVVHVHAGGTVGPWLDTPLTGDRTTTLQGVTARAFGAVGYRFHRWWAAQVRAEAGVDVALADRVEVMPSLGLLVGIEAVVPIRKKTPPPTGP